ncbi:MAG TPA: inositol monophosphatase family protein [Thermoanaerobaculia bacterium]|jgi:histidinol-phosphatase|nr:inositol monophosphatase family protein [Thermoanaerobaculia bacterium]
MNDDLRLALALADAADEITMRYFQSATLSVRTKSDRTPVSEADEAVERMIREALAKERPDDGIVGEEFGTVARTRNWIIDPIDATKNYVRGIPIFATLIALDDSVGVVSAPALHRRWWAVRGEGAFCNGRRIHVSSVDTIESAYADLQYDERNVPLIRRVGRTRCFGDFWQHMLVAEGATEIAFDPIAAWWDMAPILVIVNEAGGRFTNLAGEARADGGSGVSTNGALHDDILAALR